MGSSRLESIEWRSLDYSRDRESIPPTAPSHHDMRQRRLHHLLANSHPHLLIQKRIAVFIYKMASEVPENSQQQATAPPASQEEQVVPTLPQGADSKLPTRKDTSLREFLNNIDDFAPIVSNRL